MILTDRNDRPIEKPLRRDYESDTDFMHAFYAYKDKIASEANSGFDEGLKNSKKGGTSMASRKRGGKKARKSKGQIPMHVLIKRYDSLGRTLRRRGFKE